MKRTVLVFGLIAGVIVSVFMGTTMIIVSRSDHHSFGISSMLIGYTGMLIAFAFVFVGIKSYRDKYLSGTITYGRGLVTGLLIAFIASTMYVGMWAFVYNNFFPDYMDRYTEQMIASVDTTGKSSEQVVQMKTEVVQHAADMKASYESPVGFALWTYLEIFPVGILVALVSAAILRRKPQPPTFA